MARRRSYRGRHRYGASGLVHCRAITLMAAALRARKAGLRPVRHDVASVAARTAATGARVTPLNIPVREPKTAPRMAA